MKVKALLALSAMTLLFCACPKHDTDFSQDHNPDDYKV